MAAWTSDYPVSVASRSFTVLTPTSVSGRRQPYALGAIMEPPTPRVHVITKTEYSGRNPGVSGGASALKVRRGGVWAQL